MLPRSHFSCNLSISIIMAHRISAWFVSETGKKFTFGLVCAAGIGISSAYTVPNTVLLYKYKEIVQLYKSGIPVKLPKSIIERFNTAQDLLQVHKLHRDRIKPFTVFGFDVFNAGTIYSRFGGYVGIPLNFTYKTVDDINKLDIMVENEFVDWNKPEGKQLLDSLILSEKAQLFAMAREILTINSLKLFLDTAYGTSAFIFVYGFTNYINRKLNLYAKPFALRGILYTLVSIFGYGIYSFATDFTQNTIEKQIDQELSEKNPIFIEGGKEFYDKLMLRNIALRKLMGPYGERKYTVLGNENYLIRQRHLPVVVRRDFFFKKHQDTM